MPLLVGVAHYINKRKISVMQVQMTNSDKIKDYGEPKYVNEMLDTDVEKFIVIEDVVSHGRCSNLAINRLLEKGKSVLGVYTIIINEDFLNLEYDNNVDLKYVYLITNKQWIQFFWEKTP